MRTKTTVEQEIVTCDFCQEGDVYTDDKCIICKKDMCHDCSRNSLFSTILPAQVWGCSSRDQVVCVSCYASLESKLAGDPLLQAYLEIFKLRSEYNLWMTDFKQRMDSAEQKVRSLMDTR